MNEKMIYLDNAATTRMAPEVVKAMKPYFEDIYAVASSQFSHTPGIKAKEGLDLARNQISKKLNVKPDEIIFTSGGTESNNLAIKGVAWENRDKKNHIITSKIEQRSILDSVRWLEKQGFEATYVDVNSEGFIDIDQLKDSITDRTLIASIQHANQEVGTLQSIKEIAHFCKEKGILFHTDAQLSFTNEPLDLSEIPADLVTLSSHKIHGPKGVGGLFVRENTPIQKWIHGGFHENNLRSGTENIAGIVGFGKAVELAKSQHISYLRQLQSNLLTQFNERIDGFDLNGPKNLDKRLANNLNISFNRIEGESVVLHLDMKGIAVITGSACFSRSLEPSYVMMAMGYSHERAHGSIRFSLSRFTTEEDIAQVVFACKDVVEALRRISPIKS